MAKSNNSNLVLAVIITCLLSAGIVTGILFATKPWCDKNEKYQRSQDMSLGLLQDLPPTNCGISNYNKNTPNCEERCKKALQQNCKGYSNSYCTDQCSTGGPPPPGSENGYDFGDECGANLNYNTPIKECSAEATNCCTLKCKGSNDPCLSECTSTVVQKHCTSPPHGGGGGPPGGGNGPPPSPSPGGGGGGPPPSPSPGGGPPPSPSPGGGGGNVESSKPFFEQPAGIATIVVLVLIVGGGGAYLFMRRK